MYILYEMKYHNKGETEILITDEKTKYFRYHFFVPFYYVLMNINRTKLVMDTKSHNFQINYGKGISPGI